MIKSNFLMDPELEYVNSRYSEYMCSTYDVYIDKL